MKNTHRNTCSCSNPGVLAELRTDIRLAQPAEMDFAKLQKDDLVVAMIPQCNSKFLSASGFPSAIVAAAAGMNKHSGETLLVDCSPAHYEHRGHILLCATSPLSFAAAAAVTRDGQEVGIVARPNRPVCNAAEIALQIANEFGSRRVIFDLRAVDGDQAAASAVLRCRITIALSRAAMLRIEEILVVVNGQAEESEKAVSGAAILCTFCPHLR